MSRFPREEFSFRSITLEDMDFLRDLYASTREDELALADWPEQQKRQFLRQQFEAQHAHYQQHYPAADFDVIQHGDSPVGRRYIERWDDEYRLIDIALVPQYRNAGLGGVLMREILDKAAEEGVAVRIHVEKFNPALRLYERLGFRELEDKGVYLFMEWRSGAR